MCRIIGAKRTKSLGMWKMWNPRFIADYVAAKNRICIIYARTLDHFLALQTRNLQFALLIWERRSETEIYIRSGNALAGLSSAVQLKLRNVTTLIRQRIWSIVTTFAVVTAWCIGITVCRRVYLYLFPHNHTYTVHSCYHISIYHSRRICRFPNISNACHLCN